MANDDRPKAAKAAAAAQAPEAESPVDEVRYDADQLVVAARALLNSRPDVVAGALAAKPERKTFTLAEAEVLVKEHLDRELPADAGAA